MNFPTASTIERLPWPVRTVLGCLTGVAAVGLTYFVHPLHMFPMLLAFPTVVLCGWFFGMAGSFGCAVVDIALIENLLTREQVRFSSGFGLDIVRLVLFLVLSTLLGVLLRRFADQRVALHNEELQKRLLMEQAQRQMAEERARAGEELRERDELLQIALRVNGMGLWVWDLVADTVHRSEEAYRMVGRQAEDFGPRPVDWLEVVHPDDREELHRLINKARDEGGEYRHHYRVVWPDGSVRWLESQGKCQKDSEGRATRIVGVLSDVTHRRHTEEAMLRAEKLAVAGRLAASVAHEINNPLEAVANLLYLITLSGSTEEARAHAESALDELLRVSLLTQSTLKFHRQQGTPKITMLSEILEGVLAMFRGRMNAAGIAVKVQVRDEVAIACMPSEVQQIFVNLLGNAIEAMAPQGRLKLRMRPSRDWRNGATEGMRVTFADTGVGMDGATMKRIFEPFFTTKTETGTGLGMWVVAQLIERHSGDIRVWSTPRYGASGTVVSVFLPIEFSLMEGVEVSQGTDAAESLQV